MIKILNNKRKSKFSLILITLFIALGFIVFFLVNLSSFFDVSNYWKINDYTIDYAQGYGGIKVDFRISYRNEASFDSNFIFQTISSENVEQIGITNVYYDVYRDTQLIWDNILVFIEPIRYGIDSFIISGVSLHDNISCIGSIEAQFEVEGIVQNEKIEFILSIIMPVNPYEIRNTHLINLIWVGFCLGAIVVVLIGLIYRTIHRWKGEAKYSEVEEKKDREFFEYIGDKLEEIRKGSS